MKIVRSYIIVQPVNYDSKVAVIYMAVLCVSYLDNLNDPSEKIMYEVDPAAQIRDSVNPMVDIDRGLGQFGGGSE